MKLILLFLLIFAASVTGTVLTIKWDINNRPDPIIPMPPTSEVNHYTPGLYKLMHVSRKYDRFVAPNHTVHVSSSDTGALKAQIKYLAPRLGWYVIQGKNNSGYFRVTLPEEDLVLIDQLKENPEQWVREYANSVPKTAIAEGPINIDLHIDSYLDRPVLPIVISVICIIFAIITFLFTVVIIIMKVDYATTLRN